MNPRHTRRSPVTHSSGDQRIPVAAAARGTGILCASAPWPLGSLGDENGWAAGRCGTTVGRQHASATRARADRSNAGPVAVAVSRFIPLQTSSQNPPRKPALARNPHQKRDAARPACAPLVARVLDEANARPDHPSRRVCLLASSPTNVGPVRLVLMWRGRQFSDLSRGRLAESLLCCDDRTSYGYGGTDR